MFWTKWNSLTWAFVAILAVAIFCPRQQRFSVGASAHVGNLSGSFNFEAYENYGTKRVFCLFYSPGCGHCKRMMSDWDAFAEKNKGGEVAIIKIDCAAERELAKKHDIKGYPTIRYYAGGLDGGHKEYDGERSESAFSAFIKSLV